MYKHIRSKRSLIHIAVAMPLLLLLFCICVQSIITELLYKANPSILKLIATGFICPYILYVVYKSFYSYAPITITHEGIIINYLFSKKLLPWTAIANIRLTGKETFNMLIISVLSEATTITLHSGERILLWADGYGNMADLRVVLERAWNILSSGNNISELNFIIAKQSKVTLPAELQKGTIYRNSVFRTLLIIPLILYTILIIFLGPHLISDAAASNVDAVGWLFVLLMLSTLLLPLWALGRNYHYFVLTDNYLTIKNSLWWWSKKTYAFTDIREIVLESANQGTICLRVITTSFQSDFYPAKSLSDKTWQKLQNDLYQRGVNIRNEL